LPSYLL